MKQTRIGEQLRLFLAALIVAALTIPAHSSAGDRFQYKLQVTPEDGQIDPGIDKRYSASFASCQKRAQITQDNAACFEAEFERQDAALNEAWKTTLGRLPSTLHGPLREAQRKWIAARDPFCMKNADGFSGGTIAPVIYVSCRVELTIRRTIWLEGLH